MSTFRVPVAALLVACAASPQQKALPSTPQRGVEVGDLDRAADPCDDFFAFSNGAWRAQNPIPASMQRWSRRWQASEANKGQLRDILDEISAKSWRAGSVEQLVGDYYASCMDEARVNAAGLTPLRPLLEKIDALQAPEAVQKMIVELHDLGVAAPFAVSAQPDNHQPDQTIADISASGLGLPDRDYYLKPEPRFAQARDNYRAHLVRLMGLAAVPDPKEVSETVFAFEKRLAEASLDNVELRDPAATDHKTRFAGLETLAPHLQWAAYFDGAHLPRADLNVDQPRFLAAVDRELAQTPVSAWRAYLRWQLLAAAAPWLSEPFARESFEFNEHQLAGVPEMKPRWKRCAQSTDALFGDALGRKYIERYFPPAAKARAQELVKNLLSAMKDTIETVEWMGPATRKKALEKLATFHAKIGYPDQWKDYGSVRVRRETFWQNFAAGRAWNVNDDRSLVGKPTDRGRWGMTPPTSNASYDPFLNEITFPAGILQPPAFSLDATDAVNYGGMGVGIGHEISHGFDDQGSQYDAQGRLQNWWTKADLDEFHSRAQCVSDQFEGYFVEPGLHHNGKLVLGEAIGDLGGAHLAWKALQKALQQHPAPPSTDGFTPDQQFFIAWGQFRGDEIRPEAQRLMIQGDPHPVAKFRVIGPLSNLPAFQQAFSCKAGAAMVRPPEKRCDVW